MCDLGEPGGNIRAFILYILQCIIFRSSGEEGFISPWRLQPLTEGSQGRNSSVNL